MTDDGFIGLPPGFAPPAPDTDSSTVKHQRPERPDVVFRAIVPGAPPVLPPPPAPGAAVPGAPPAAVAASAPSAPPVPAAHSAVKPPTAPAPTVVSVPTWRLRIPGISDPIEVASAAVLGRNPSAPADAASAFAVSIHDPAKSVSKTHALVQVVGSQLHVRDLDSTNGVWIRTATTAPRRVEPGESVAVPSGADLELGEFVVRVEFG